MLSSLSSELRATQEVTEGAGYLGSPSLPVSIPCCFFFLYSPLSLFSFSDCSSNSQEAPLPGLCRPLYYSFPQLDPDTTQAAPLGWLTLSLRPQGPVPLGSISLQQIFSWEIALPLQDGVGTILTQKPFPLEAGREITG